MTPDLFVSCADRNIRSVKPFVGELLEQIRQRSDLTWYFYEEDDRVGENWAAAAAAALRSAKLFLPVYSPHFFDSEFCGREYAAFMRRLELGRANCRRVMPILWLPDARHDGVPAAVRHIVDTRSLLPHEYAELGFEGLFDSRNRSDSPYGRILRELANKVVERARDEPDFPPGPEVDLLAGPTIVDTRGRLPRVSTIAQAEQIRSTADLHSGPVPPSSGAPLKISNSLPPESATFSGRCAELTRIFHDLRTSDRSPGTARVVAIHGMPGVGKTALALHLAHKVASQYTQCLYLDLQAHSDDQRPRTVAEVLGQLLLATDVPAANLPAAEQQRLARWRDYVAREHAAGGRLLLVLDNAASSQQVAPLIPAAPGCLVLVTSRSLLGDLYLALPVKLTPLHRSEARKLFCAVGRREDFTTEQLDNLLHMAGDLPLAITILASLYGLHETWDMSDLIAQAQWRGLDISAEERTITAAFDLSYDNLDKEKQRVFSLLGVHPGRIIDRDDVAALAGASTDRGRRHVGSLLESLFDASLLVEAGCGRYTMHDLIRQYVEGKAAELPADERRRALTAVVHYYATRSHQFAREAGWALLRHDTPGPRRPPDPLADGRFRALKWFTSKRVNLLDILGLLGQNGAADESWQETIRPALVSLVAAMAGYLRNNGPWETAEELHAGAAKQSSTEPLARAIALNNLGITRRLLGQLDPSGPKLSEAESAVVEAAEIFARQVADPRTRRMGRANALNERGIIANERGLMAAENGDLTESHRHHLEAKQHLLEARELYDMTEEPDLIGRANSAKNLGVAFAGLDQAEPADHWLEVARQQYAAIGDALGEAEVLNFRGRLLVHKGTRLEDAARYLKAALATLRRGRVVSALEEAKAYEGLSYCSPTRADAHRRRARLRYADIGVNEAVDE